MSSPMMFFVALIVGVVGVELVTWAKRSMSEAIPATSLMVVAPVAVRLAITALVAVRLVAAINSVQQVINSLGLIGHW